MSEKAPLMHLQRSTGTCLNCGDVYVKDDGTCPRCGKLAIVTPATQLAADGTKYGTPTDPPAPKPAAIAKVVLPNTKEARAWMDQTVLMIARFETEIADLEQRVTGLQAQLEQRRLAVFALKAIPDKVEIAARPDRGVVPAVGIQRRWSLHHDACVVCGGTDVKHMARGHCQRCYHRSHGKAAA